MTVDVDTVDLLLRMVQSSWPRTLDEFEAELWTRTLVPPIGEPLDPDLVATALEQLRTRPEFEFARPDVVAFRSVYERLVVLNTPEPLPVTSKEDARIRVAELRAILADDAELIVDRLL